MTAEQLLSRLNNVKCNGGGWTADCPCHDSKSGKSLHVKEADGKLLLKCWGGCKTEDVVGALGLSMGDLFEKPGGNGHPPAPSPGRARLPEDPLSWLSNYCGVPIDFVRALPLEADGNAVAFTFPGLAVRKLRTSGSKSFTWTPAGSPSPPLWPMPEATMPPGVWLLEGESDAIVALCAGLPAYALTHGAGTPVTPDQAAELRRRGAEKATIVFDADKAGREGTGKLAAVLEAAGIEAAGVDLAAAGIVDPLAGTKDVRDAWLAVKDPVRLRERLESASSSLQPNLPPIGRLVVGEVGREVSAAALKARPHREVEYLPFLGSAGYVPKGWSVMIAASPKGGKTELTTRLCGEWTTESILYATEEPELIWQHRLSRLPGDWNHMRLLFALGMEPTGILNRIKTGSESVVVLDTVRSLIGLTDENDNSELARALNPYVVAAREGGKTLIALHHVRKGGGNYGEGITGGHAFLAAVDVALELLRESNLGENKRRVRGWGRLFPIDEAVYSLEDDGTMALLGSPTAVQLGAVTGRVQELLNSEWQTRKELLEDLDEPKPAQEQLRLALKALVEDGTAERDPKGDKPGVTYRYRLAQPGNQPHLPRTPSMVVGEVGGSQDPPPDPDDDTLFHDATCPALHDGPCNCVPVWAAALEVPS